MQRYGFLVTLGLLMGLFTLSGCNQKAGLSGVLNGTSNNGSSSVTGPSSPTASPTPAPLACTFNGASVASGSSVTAYLGSTVPFGQTCSSQSRKCNNGTLGGSYTFSTCTVSAAPTPTPAPTPVSTPVAGAPQAPTNFLLLGQGPNTVTMSWTASVRGSNPVASYNIYRSLDNGKTYPLYKQGITGTTFTDTNATGATAKEDSSGDPLNCATSYAYNVSAVDTANNESAQASNMTSWFYHNGVSAWGESSWSYGGVSINFNDTAGGPESGPFDIAFNAPAGSGWQPYPNSFSSSTNQGYTLYDFEMAGFNYITLDMKPTQANQTWRMSMMSRFPWGDNYPWSAANISDYGPTPTVGQWNTYTIPLSTLTMGVTTFTGSISGNTLTVTGSPSGVGVDAGGWLFINGAATGIMVVGTGPNNGGPGSYAICGPGPTAASGSGCKSAGNMASTTITEQRTDLYKIDIINESSSTNYYIDNIKFTRTK